MADPPKTSKCWAYHPSGQEDDWKLPMCTDAGELDAGLIGGAAAALGAGFRGQKVDLPEGAVSGVKAAVRAAWKKVHPDKEDSDMPEGIKASDGWDSRSEYEAELRSELRGVVDDETWSKAVRTARSRTGGRAPRKAETPEAVPASVGETAAFSGAVKACGMWEDDYYRSPAPKLPQSDSRVSYRKVFDLPEPSADGGLSLVGEPRGDLCHNCRFYQWGACSLVEGTIEANYTCDLHLAPARLSIYASEGNATLGTAFALHDLIEDGGSCRLFNEQTFGEAPDWIHFMPAPGEFAHPNYGNIVITRERNERILDNFKSGIYQEKLPIDVEHDLELSGAVAWIDDMQLNEDGSIEAHVAWNTHGRALVEDDRFAYFSPSVMPSWPHTVTGERIPDVAIGGALTTHPYFKERWLRPIVASEGGGLAAYPMPERTSGTKEHTMSEQNLNPVAPATAATAAVAAPAPAAAPATQPGVITLSDEQARDFAEFQKLGGAGAITRLSEQLDKATTDLAGVQSDRRRERFTAMVAGRGGADDGAPWFGDPEKAVSLLVDVADKFGEDSDAFKNLVERERATAAAMKGNRAFSEIGSGATPPSKPAGPTADGSAFSEAVTQKMSEAAAAGKPIELADARAQVASAHPDLYEDYRAGQFAINIED